MLTAITFAPVRNFEFVNYDDFEFVAGNPHVAGGLTAENIRWAWQNAYVATGGPLTWMSHMLDVELFGLAPGPHHMTSLALHAFGAVMLLLSLRTMTGSTWRSAFVAALFAVHPLHVESVAWVAERKDVLSGVFFSLTLAAYAWHARRPGAVRYAAVLALFVLGLLSKPMVVTLPFVLLLLDVWPLQRVQLASPSFRQVRALVIEKIPLIAIGAVAMAWTFKAQQDLGAVSGVSVIPLSVRISNAAVSYVAYLGKALWPADLVPFYPYRTSVPAAAVIACVVLLAGITGAVLRLSRRAPYASVGWLWYVGMMVPVIGLVQVGGHAMADRFTYLPMTGVFVMVAWGLHRLSASAGLPPWLLAVGASTVIVLSAGAARAQARHWQNGLSLWEHTVRVDPENARAFSNLGVVLARHNRHGEAIRAYEKALSLQPGVPQTHHNLGLALQAVGRTDEAMAHFERAVALKPDYAKARMHLANQLADRGRTDEALQQYGEAMRHAPDDPLARANMAVTLALTGRHAEGIPHMLEAARLDPGNLQFRYLAAGMMIDAGDRAGAEQILREILAVDPTHADARRALDRIRP